MLRGIFAILLAVLLLRSHASADVYRYEDNSGTVIMTDRPEKVPEGRRNDSRLAPGSSEGSLSILPRGTERRAARPLPGKDPCTGQLEEAARMCGGMLDSRERPAGISADEYAVALHAVCGSPALESLLTETELRQVRELGEKAREAEKRIPPKKLYELKAFAAMLSSGCHRKEPKEEYSRNDLDGIARELTGIWREMASALAAQNFKRAARFFHETVRDDWVRQFRAFPGKTLKQIGQDLLKSRLVVDRVEGDHRAVCQLLSDEEGTTYSYQLIFLRGLDHEWKIYSF